MNCRSVAARPPAGFTLIELLVVLFIIAVLLAVASPAYERILPGLELSAAARDLAASLRTARMEALAEGREVAVIFDTLAGVYRVDRRETARAFPADATVTVTTARSELGEEGVARIRFFPDGASTGGQIALARGGAAHTVDVIWLTGHVAILP